MLFLADAPPDSPPPGKQILSVFAHHYPHCLFDHSSWRRSALLLDLRVQSLQRHPAQIRGMSAARSYSAVEYANFIVVSKP